ncbi:hypothetical protein BS50DRAFT_18382 [Corynespora cassiicola Philippines]|uniref:Uncharacterized protein n=1 Tax=Corynespora cassiicola Philippines TaxID=1448308 RepID=A0A2T2PA55_CORCC|nr:hypothetical protein BS50DRAFT_18382 [Corynespora cassiicola Philippines]
MISACQTQVSKRGRPGFDSPRESNPPNRFIFLHFLVGVVLVVLVVLLLLLLADMSPFCAPFSKHCGRPLCTQFTKTRCHLVILLKYYTSLFFRMGSKRRKRADLLERRRRCNELSLRTCTTLMPRINAITPCS